MSHCAMVYHIINNTLDTAHQVLLTCTVYQNPTQIAQDDSHIKCASFPLL